MIHSNLQSLRFGAIQAQTQVIDGHSSKHLETSIQFETPEDRAEFGGLLDYMVQNISRHSDPDSIILTTGKKATGQPFMALQSGPGRTYVDLYEDNHLETFKQFVAKLPIDQKYRDFLTQAAHNIVHGRGSEQLHLPLAEQVQKELTLATLEADQAALIGKKEALESQLKTTTEKIAQNGDRIAALKSELGN